MHNYYNEFDFEPKPTKQELAQQKRKKQQQATMFIALLLIGGLAFYFLSYLPDEKLQAKEEIEEVLKDNYLVTVDKLDANLWEGSESWEEYLDGLFLPAQVKVFKERMIKSIEKKSEELEEEERNRPRKMREEAIDSIKNYLEEKERQLPDIQKIIEKATEKINNTPVNDLSSVKDKAYQLIDEKRHKRKRLYWLLPPQNWADRWLLRNKQSLNAIWTDKMTITLSDGRKIEPSYFETKSIYRIQFPPSLWNELTDEQKQLAETNGHGELTLRDEVHNYKFSPLIEDWENKVKPNPVRGEIDPNDLSNLDNNALFYGAPRTGKSVMAEKLAYEADVYPLVVIQGSTLTPNKTNVNNDVTLLIKFFFTISSITYDLVEDYGFERAEDGEVRYILFLDEADQVCMNTFDPPKHSSSELTFLKECMGSDNKNEESKNLWIAATNHLDSINIAIYQAGRLSNPLCFSWTLGEFMMYADGANISSQFPTHWIENKTLNDEDNKWVNRFNKIIFDKDFLPFWNKFVGHNPNCEYEPEKDDDRQQNTNQQTNQPKKVKIKWGEFLEFFWRLYDSKQLESFEGKFENLRTPKLENVLVNVDQTLKITANKLSEDLSKALDTRLNELNDSLKDIRDEIRVGQDNMNRDISRALDRNEA